MLRLVVTLLAGLLLAGCATSGDDLAPKTAGHVDLKRYQGTWYELARMPMYFQRNCVQSEARYSLMPDGRMAVFNRCLTEQWKWEEAKGTATPQVPGQTDKLWVRFDNWFTALLPGLAKGNYWVLYVSDDYHTAIVGDPSRRYLWLLSRSTKVNADVREDLLSRARQQGYDTTRLIWRTPDSKMPH
ncbi:lipocalin [Pseudomonas gingeri NCPPB 3146 = LMG 5327]|uniref:Outer membrane lipoprotein Blc n=2 Tax=Pseudomonas gingeri TaxID=117681 RepID=A0A7Y7Y0A3_9PSED|nr:MULTISPECIES: lipocalin family protein [Pseudomonas]NVZ25203.1 lipocalin family protein [Pseudomonas gingeri]NWA06730.1 lipocalin family protein [Pseudomonas gingeri]NWC15588.1 lipocalin family protein [Pseudomonas gingeri]NWE68045.1 lipocalin family protein [Pseudomonas gingeri]PNQ90079.1 lipocalin [Pseudomonas gingeri NCPPB 3146 = LMG 5327]